MADCARRRLADAAPVAAAAAVGGRRGWTDTTALTGRRLKRRVVSYLSGLSAAFHDTAANAK